MLFPGSLSFCFWASFLYRATASTIHLIHDFFLLTSTRSNMISWLIININLHQANNDSYSQCAYSTFSFLQQNLTSQLLSLQLLLQKLTTYKLPILARDSPNLTPNDIWTMSINNRTIQLEWHLWDKPFTLTDFQIIFPMTDQTGKSNGCLI